MSGRLNAVLDEKDMTSGDEGRDKPFIEFVHSLQVHVAGLPHVLINQIKSGMSDELVQMPVIILSRRISVLLSLISAKQSERIDGGKVEVGLEDR